MAYVLTIFAAILLDQLTKKMVVSHLGLYESVPIIGSFLRFTYTSNTGGAFGIFSKHPILFVTLAIVLCILGIAFYRKIVSLDWPFQLGIGLILGGTTGNLIDRLTRGSVVDFIDFSFWPTFNVADIAISVGSALLIILLLRYEAKERQIKESEEADYDDTNLGAEMAGTKLMQQEP